eukprot:gene10481-14042_t
MKIRGKILTSPATAMLMLVLMAAFSVLMMSRLNGEIAGFRQGALMQQQASLTARAHLNAAHALAYRTLTWGANLSKDDLLAARGKIRAIVDQAADELGRGAAGAEGDKTLAEVAKFAKSLDRALEMSAIDANDGITQMADADKLAATLATEVDRRVAHANEGADTLFAVSAASF